MQWSGANTTVHVKGLWSDYFPLYISSGIELLRLQDYFCYYKAEKCVFLDVR